MRTRFNENVSIKLGSIIQTVGDVEQRGINASIDLLRQFVAPTGRFNNESIGKELTILNSSFPENNKTTQITSIVNANTVVVADLIVADSGPISWELRPKVEQDDRIVTVQVRSGDVSSVKPGWVLNDGFSDFTVLARRTFAELKNSPLSLTVKEGTNGTINSSGNFTSITASFTQRDVGKLLSISNSTAPENNTRFEIKEILSTTEAVVEGQDGTSPTETTDSFFWAVLPFAELELFSRIAPKGTVELEGVQGELTGPTTFKVNVGEFTDSDIGKLLTLRGAATSTNNTTTEIVSVSGDTATISDTLSADDGILTPPFSDPSIGWEMRQATAQEDTTSVTIRPPDLISRLARDFGIEIDNQETEKRQRDWVENVHKWINIKGTPKSYEILGTISGFNVTVEPLYRISQDIASSNPEVLDVGEAGVGRAGTDGTLSVVSSFTRFTSPIAEFSPTDVGNQIRIQNADTSANNKLYTIEKLIDSNTVEFRIADQATLPDANNGSLTWAVVRLYTTLAPLIPLFDEFDVSFMEQIIDGNSPQTTDKFGVDKYCWESDFFADVEITIDSTTQLAPGVHEISTSDGPPQGPSSIAGNASVVKGVGNWSLIDSGGTEFFLETVPSAGPPYVFEIRASTPPVTGSATLRYNCPEILSCDYCKASAVVATIEADSILADPGISLERALERVVERLKQVLPAHVKLIPKFSQSLEATVDVESTVETP